MLYEVSIKKKFPLGEDLYQYTVYVEQNHEAFIMMEVSDQEIAVKQAIVKFFMAGNALYEGASLEIVSVNPALNTEPIDLRYITISEDGLADHVENWY